MPIDDEPALPKPEPVAGGEPPWWELAPTSKKTSAEQVERASQEQLRWDKLNAEGKGDQAPKSVAFPGGEPSGHPAFRSPVKQTNKAAAAAAAPSSFVLEHLSALPARGERTVAAAAAPGGGDGPRDPVSSHTICQLLVISRAPL